MVDIRFAFLIVFLFAVSGCGQSTSLGPTETMPAEIWWTYLADYDGRPGSTVVNLALKRAAPSKGHRTLLVTGVNYPVESNGSGLPNEAELDFLNHLHLKRLEVITRQSDAIFVGSFTHNGERLDYFYIADAEGLEYVLSTFYKSECPDRKPYINIKSDSEWDAFLNFLYPNSATIERHRAELIKRGVI